MALSTKPQVASVDSAFGAVEALNDLGGKAPLPDITRAMGVSQVQTSRKLRRAIAEGWVEHSGQKSTRSARYALTSEGRAEFRKRHPTRLTTVPLGSGSVPFATAGDIDPYERVNVEIAVEDVPRLSPKAEATIVAGIITKQGQDKSLKERVIEALSDGKSWGLIGLTQAIRTSHRDTTSPRDVGAILNSLNQQGKVTFREGGHENGHHSLTEIRATKAFLRELGVPEPVGVAGERRATVPRKREDSTDYRNYSHRAEGGPIERSHREAAAVLEPTVGVPSAPEPEKPTTGSFPLLAALQARMAAQSEAVAKAEKYLEAAAALEKIDPEESARLSAKASEAAGEPFSALEAEYLAYASGVAR